jgi:hypothetical protein
VASWRPTKKGNGPKRERKRVSQDEEVSIEAPNEARQTHPKLRGISRVKRFDGLLNELRLTSESFGNFGREVEGGAMLMIAKCRRVSEKRRIENKSQLASPDH